MAYLEEYAPQPPLDDKNKHCLVGKLPAPYLQNDCLFKVFFF